MFYCEHCKTKNSFFHGTSPVAASSLPLPFEIITDYLLVITNNSYFVISTHLSKQLYTCFKAENNLNHKNFWKKY